MPMPENASDSPLLARVRGALDESASRLVPWFEKNMPEYYFRSHTEEERIAHLRAIISGQVFTQGQTVHLGGDKGSRLTYISPGCDPKELIKVLKGHVGMNIQTARIYSTLDSELTLSTLLFAPQARADRESQAFAEARRIMRENNQFPMEWEVSFSDFLALATQDYLDKFDPVRAARHFRAYRVIRGKDSVYLSLEPLSDESRLTMAMFEPPGTGLVLEILKILERAGIRVNRCYADAFGKESREDEFAILSFYVRNQDKPLTEEDDVWKRVRPGLELVKWFAPHDLEAFADDQGWTLRRVLLLQAAAEFAHQFLVKANLWAYTAVNIVTALLKHREEAAKCIEYFEARFDPDQDNGAEYIARLKEDAEKAVACVNSEVARETLSCILRFFSYCLRSNYYLDQVFGLGFRLDPDFLDIEDRREMPYGVFFFHGPYAQGFHVRYREMARGGLRVVTTRSQEQFELESNRLFDEVTGLARAQQFKNKDIPEGGAKAVLLLGPNGDICLSVKSFVNSLLDLILPDPGDPASPTLPRVKDYLGKEEVIYLGPDENITPEHIIWTVQRAGERGYKWPSAFMSSKPGAGINHKEYGVTSLGVIVFTHEILLALGIDPHTRPFTVKMTGGPRGDVAGNAVKILARDYGANARIVAMTDGHGAAHDPDGLDQAELLRLIEEQRGIGEFPRDKIKSPDGFVVTTDEPDGARIRNQLHNTARADVFIPAGGRPDTINERNWEEFLDAEGEPTAKAIVEGANIFISQEARDRLQARGVLIVHGSSANKTGVICSSYEILGGLVMSEEEFLEVKPRYVTEVLHILKIRAQAEARLMLREYKSCGGCKPLTSISLELSREINVLADTLYETLVKDSSDITKDPALLELLMSYCPPVLVERYRDRIVERVPSLHLYALVAAFISSRIVYSEGMGWLTRLSGFRDLPEVVRAYLAQEKKLAALIAEVRQSPIADKLEVARLLDAAGRKFLTSEYLGLE